MGSAGCDGVIMHPLTRSAGSPHGDRAGGRLALGKGTAVPRRGAFTIWGHELLVPPAPPAGAGKSIKGWGCQR